MSDLVVFYYRLLFVTSLNCPVLDLEKSDLQVGLFLDAHLVVWLILVSDTSHNFCIFNLVDPASSHIFVSQSSFSTCHIVVACN